MQVRKTSRYYLFMEGSILLEMPLSYDMASSYGRYMEYYEV